MRVELDFNGFGAIRHLEGAADRAEDVRPAGPAVRRALVDMERRHFLTGGSGRWQPEQRHRGRNPRPMFETGALFRSLATVRGRGQHFATRRDGFDFGTRIFYARFHHKRQSNPRRPIFPTERTVVRAVKPALERHLRGGLIRDAL